MPLSFLITIFVIRLNYNSLLMPAMALLSLQTLIVEMKMVIRVECRVKTELTFVTVEIGDENGKWQEKKN